MHHAVVKTCLGVVNDGWMKGKMDPDGEDRRRSIHSRARNTNVMSNGWIMLAAAGPRYVEAAFCGGCARPRGETEPNFVLVRPSFSSGLQ